MNLAIGEIAAPLVRLIGHSLAAAVGFCALAAVLLIPIEVVKLLMLFGFSQVARPLQILGQTLLFADVCLFAVIFVSGIAGRLRRGDDRGSEAPNHQRSWQAQP